MADGTLIEFFDQPVLGEDGLVTLGRWGGWLVQVMPMLYNDRLILTPQSFQSVYDFGWCYPKGGAAELAARVWDPEVQGEPAGFTKAVGNARRRPGERCASA
ncbi:hypothetical protein I0C86_40445 [Plantactinospora sp. S1510]|uniref:Uncharacterized protein n=1 Tax=Plantactinospora alkalitolerans TaxID=2789879 RepID=A0ABS0HA66_9ACTN|nr:hypothetical protein [Plantactinospora alkalitolerans]MBF9135151.1 hypothetical protein [Plantactinospora alkalitolerans]